VADCALWDVTCHARHSVTNAVTGVVQGAFEKMCHEFADAGAAVLKAVANAFLASSTIDLNKAGIDGIMVITTSIGMGLALLLLLGQIIRTGLTMRGEHLAHGLVGVFKAALATATVLSVATVLLAAADALSRSILDSTFGGAQAFSDRFGRAVAFESFTATGGPVALLLIFGLVAVIVGAVLFAEMLFRHAAIVVIVAAAPIGASGLVAGSTTGWWRKLVTAGVQLIFLKPLIVLVFAVGFAVAGNSGDVLGLLAGLTTLLIAAFAWPVLARFCTWTSAHVAEAGGATAFVGGFLGAEAARVPGRLMSAQSRGSSFDSDRATMARNSAFIDSAASGAGGQLVGASVGGAAGGAAAGPVGLGVAAAGQAVTGLRDHIHQGMSGMADHGGLDRPPPRRGPDTPPTTGTDPTNGDPQ
jgi:hypothetical protein